MNTNMLCQNTESHTETKSDTYNYLMDLYVDTIHKLIDTSYTLNILPLKVIFGINYIKKYITNNRIEILQNVIFYLLTNK